MPHGAAHSAQQRVHRQRRALLAAQRHDCAPLPSIPAVVQQHDSRPGQECTQQLEVINACLGQQVAQHWAGQETPFATGQLKMQVNRTEWLPRL